MFNHDTLKDRNLFHILFDSITRLSRIFKSTNSNYDFRNISINLITSQN